MINNNRECMEVGKVYRARLVKSADIEKDKMIATMFLIEGSGGRPIQFYWYGRLPKSTLLQWYRGKYGVDYGARTRLYGTYWYIWRCPDNPDYVSVIKRSDGAPDTGVELDEWGFPLEGEDGER